MEEREAQKILKKEYRYVRNTFFPSWDKNSEWRAFLDPDLPSLGRYYREEKKIIVQYVPEDIDHLHCLLIHEICHHFGSRHRAPFFRRFLKAAEKAQVIGKHRLHKMIVDEVRNYKKFPEIKAQDVYDHIYDVLRDMPGMSYGDVVQYLTGYYGMSVYDFERVYRRSRKVYEKAQKEINREMKCQEELRKRLNGE